MPLRLENETIFPAVVEVSALLAGDNSVAMELGMQADFDAFNFKKATVKADHKKAMAELAAAEMRFIIPALFSFHRGNRSSALLHVIKALKLSSTGKRVIKIALCGAEYDAKNSRFIFNEEGVKWDMGALDCLNGLYESCKRGADPTDSPLFKITFPKPVETIDAKASKLAKVMSKLSEKEGLSLHDMKAKIDALIAAQEAAGNIG
jgi:hypothetical protein